MNSGKDYKHLSRGSIPVYGTGGYMLSVDKELSNVDAIGIGRKGTIDHPQYLKAPFWTVDTLFFMTPKKDINIDFAFGLSQTINWKKYDESTGLPSLSKKSIDNISIKLPNYNEQIKIGRIISQIDNVLSLQQRKLEQLELLQKSILQTIFTSNNKKEKIELNKLANYRRGSFPQPYTNKKWYGGKNSKPFVQVIDVNDNLKLHEQTKERISEIAQPKSVFVPKGSIIVTLQGSIGRVAITQYDSYVDRTLLILTDFKKKIDKYYFANALKMVFNKEKLKAPGGTIKTITKSTLSSFKIVLPNIKLQIQYGKLLKSVDKQIILNKNRIMKLKKIKQFLLQNIFI